MWYAAEAKIMRGLCFFWRTMPAMSNIIVLLTAACLTFQSVSGSDCLCCQRASIGDASAGHSCCALKSATLAPAKPKASAVRSCCRSALEKQSSGELRATFGAEKTTILSTKIEKCRCVKSSSAFPAAIARTGESWRPACETNALTEALTATLVARSRKIEPRKRVDHRPPAGYELCIRIERLLI